MRKSKLFILALAAFVSSSAWGQTWTDFTSKITNPSFETGTALSDPKTNYSTTCEGWTVTPESASNSQVGIVASNATIQGVATSLIAPEGNQFFYMRTNWNASTNFNITQKIESTATLPVGLYKLTLKVVTNSSSWNKSKHSIILQEENGTASTVYLPKTDASWTNAEVYLYKKSSDTYLTISANMLAGDANGGQHYQLIIDDVKLYYSDCENISPLNVLDLTTNISNPSFEFGNFTGWTNNGMSTQTNTSFPNKDGNVYAERWQSSNLSNCSISQTINNLPNGYYTVKAAAGFDGDGATFFANDDNVTIGANGEYKIITNVTDHTLTIGVNVKDATSNYVRFDNFRLEYTKDDPTLYALKADLKTAYEAAEAITGKMYTGTKTALETEISNAKTTYNNASATTTDIQNQIDALTTAVDNANASIADYENLNSQIAKAESYTLVVSSSASDYTAAISAANTVYDEASAETCAATIKSLTDFKVADYNYVAGTYQHGVALGEWTTTGYVANFNNEHWSGTTHNYKNQDDSNGRGWNSSTGFKIGLNQDVKLPAGKYVFKACGRKSAGATMELCVKVKDGDEIGKVTDFPNGSASRGINKDGATSFDEDDDAYANNGNGFGWEWRFVEFELTTETTINVSVSASATVAHEWASFGDYSVLTDNDANIAMIAYNIALNDAKLAIANDTYKNVTGVEKTALQDAIDADMTGKTKAEIEAATTVLTEATTAFTDAAPAYDAYVTAKDESVETLYYASTDKYDAISTAKSATEPTTATEATSVVNNIAIAVRAYVESNAMAEGVDGAEDKTNLITNADFTDGLNGWTSSQTGGNIGCKSKDNDEPLTSADGSTYNYYDYWNSSANNQHATQVLESLPAGKYIFTVSARADVNLNPVYAMVKVTDKEAQKIEISKIGSTGGVFGRGWNDYTIEFTNEKVQDVTIGVITDPTNGNKGGWFGFTRARLAKIAEAADMTITDAKYATFCAPFDVTIPSGVKAYSCNAVDGNTLTLVEVETTIPANTPVIVNSESKFNQTFYGKKTEGTPSNGFLTGVYTETTVPEGSYVLVKRDDVAKFAIVGSTPATVPANRAYLTVSSGAKEFFLEEATGIASLSTVNGQQSTAAFNLAGQAVGADYKGIVIMNGKKVLKQ